MVYLGILGNQCAQPIQTARFCVMLLLVDRHLKCEDDGAFFGIGPNENPRIDRGEGWDPGTVVDLKFVRRLGIFVDEANFQVGQSEPLYVPCVVSVFVIDIFEECSASQVGGSANREEVVLNGREAPGRRRQPVR